MPFNSQNHTLALAAICSKEGLVLDVPPSGKLVVCSGDTLRCVLRLKDPTKIESLKIEIAGYQYSAQDIRSTIPSLKSAGTSSNGLHHSSKGSANESKRSNEGSHTQLFRVVRHVGQAEARSSEGGVQFEFVFPDRDNRGERLPPSFQLEGKRSVGTMGAYCRYQIAAHIERKSMGRIKSETVVLPIPYIPFSENPTPPQLPPIATFLARTTPDRIPEVPEKWKVESFPDAWAVQAGGALSFRRRSTGDQAVSEGIIRVQFAVPNLDSWPHGQSVPYHLLITFTSQTPSTLDLIRSELLFSLEQRIQCRDHLTGATEGFAESVEPGEPNSAIGFEVLREGIWSSTEKDGNDWRKVLVQMGSIRIDGLPAFFSDTVDLSYQIRLDIVLPNDSLFASKKNAFRLATPKLSSPIHEGLPGLAKHEEQAIKRLKLSEDFLSMLGDRYWKSDEDFGNCYGYGEKTYIPDDLYKKFENPITWRSAIWGRL